MASDSRKIVIEIMGGEGGKSGTSSNKKEKKEKDQVLSGLSAALHPLQTLENLVIGDRQSANYVYDNLKNLAIEGVMTSLGRTYRLTEDYLSQNVLNNVQTAIGKAGSFAGAIIAGAKVGSMMAPGAGTVVGAAFGLGFSLLGESISGSSTLSQHHSAINAATYQSEFSRQRAGLVDEGRGTQN